MRFLTETCLFWAFGCAAEARTSGPLKPTPRAQHFMDLASTPERARGFLSGKTRITGDNRHGVQVEYNAPDGHTYLWYPGSPRITPGLWKTMEVLAPDGIHKAVRVCYVYSVNSVDPTNGSRGGSWSCVPGWYALIRT